MGDPNVRCVLSKRFPGDLNVNMLDEIRLYECVEDFSQNMTRDEQFEIVIHLGTQDNRRWAGAGAKSCHTGCDCVRVEHRPDHVGSASPRSVRISVWARANSRSSSSSDTSAKASLKRASFSKNSARRA